MFNDSWLKKELFKTAFIHRSYLNEFPETKQSNERLEFLGDAILSFIISTLLFRLRPQDAEGDLTNLRSFIVKTQSLAKAAKKLNLGKYLKLSRGEELSGGRTNQQILANTYEALIGAIFLDRGIDATTEFVSQSLMPLFDQELISGPPKDAKSMLQELVQEKAKQSPRYKIIKTSGPDHAKNFLVGVFMQGKQIGQGQGLSKQEAEEAAASQALQIFSKS